MVLDVVLGAGRRIAARVVHAGRAVRCNLEGLPRLCLAILVRRHVERARRRRRVRLVDELDMRLGLVWLDGLVGGVDLGKVMWWCQRPTRKSQRAESASFLHTREKLNAPRR